MTLRKPPPLPPPRPETVSCSDQGGWGRGHGAVQRGPRTRDGPPPHPAGSAPVLAVGLSQEEGLMHIHEPCRSAHATLMAGSVSASSEQQAQLLSTF